MARNKSVFKFTSLFNLSVRITNMLFRKNGFARLLVSLLIMVLFIAGFAFLPRILELIQPT